MDQTPLQFFPRSFNLQYRGPIVRVAYLCWKDNWIEEEMNCVFALCFQEYIRGYQTRMTICNDCFERVCFKESLLTRLEMSPFVCLAKDEEALPILPSQMSRFSFPLGIDNWFWAHGFNSLHLQRSNATITSLKLKTQRTPRGFCDWIMTVVQWRNCTLKACE